MINEPLSVWVKQGGSPSSICFLHRLNGLEFLLKRTVEAFWKGKGKVSVLLFGTPSAGLEPAVIHTVVQVWLIVIQGMPVYQLLHYFLMSSDPVPFFHPPLRVFNSLFIHMFMFFFSGMSWLVFISPTDKTRKYAMSRKRPDAQSNLLLISCDALIHLVFPCFIKVCLPNLAGGSL